MRKYFEKCVFNWSGDVHKVLLLLEQNQVKTKRNLLPRR